jgi:apolipoprotein D and lipocalin family protein
MRGQMFVPSMLVRSLPWMVMVSVMMSLGCASARGQAPNGEVVDHVDIERYLGTWHEIATFPIRAQRGCVGTTATYGLRKDGDISVYNRCYDGSFDGRVKDIEGKAWVADKTTNARLKVQFFWPFRSSYWIVDLHDDYQWAVVSGPGKNNLWILSRTPCMDQTTFDTLYTRLADRGYDMSRLRPTPQRTPDGAICTVEIPS